MRAFHSLHCRSRPGLTGFTPSVALTLVLARFSVRHSAKEKDAPTDALLVARKVTMAKLESLLTTMRRARYGAASRCGETGFYGRLP